MTFYEQEVLRIKGIVYSNQGQIDTAIRTRSYIEDHYDRDLNLDLLAQHLFVSKYHLLRIFKRYDGQTPRQYLINKRIEMSKEHLKSGMSVTEACFAVGFESVGSFGSLFKRKTGQTPGQFKKSNFREAT